MVRVRVCKVLTVFLKGQKRLELCAALSMTTTYHSPSSHQSPLPLFPLFVPPLVCAAPPLLTFISVLLPFSVSASLFSLSIFLCLLFFTYLSVLLSDTRLLRLLLSPVLLPPPSFSSFSLSIPMVVSRLGPPGLGAGAVWAAYTTVFIPLSSSLYSSKALHFFYWVSERVRERVGEIDAEWCGIWSRCCGGSTLERLN